jgi:anti-sigma factor RsiW
MTYAHRQASRLLDALVDRELDESTAQAVSSHVRECHDCDGAFFLTGRIKDSLGKLAALTAPGLEAWVSASGRWWRRVIRRG